VNRVVILLGSNIDKESNLPEASRLLAAAGGVTAVSSVFESIPVGLREQPNFFNAAVCIMTSQTAADLKAGLLSDIEQRLKRVRQADKNAPRTIDCDIVLFNNACFDYAGPDGKLRHVPDPDLLRFAHVALPVAELNMTFPHPETGESLGSIAHRLREQAVLDGRPAIWERPDIRLLPA
jgi:2-amino-4-hydroxy-6-hydroxymethyldihydropteridine diphosphokinase